MGLHEQRVSNLFGRISAEWWVKVKKTLPEMLPCPKNSSENENKQKREFFDAHRPGSVELNFGSSFTLYFLSCQLCI